MLPPQDQPSTRREWMNYVAGGAGVVGIAGAVGLLWKQGRIADKHNTKPPSKEDARAMIPQDALRLTEGREQPELFMHIERLSREDIDGPAMEDVNLVFYKLSDTELRSGKIDLALSHRVGEPVKESRRFFRNQRRPEQCRQVTYDTLDPTQDAALLARVKAELQALHGSAPYEDLLAGIPNLYISGKSMHLHDDAYEEHSRVILVDKGEKGEYIWAGYSVPTPGSAAPDPATLGLYVIERERDPKKPVPQKHIPLRPGQTIRLGNAKQLNHISLACNALLKDPSQIPVTVAGALRRLHDRTEATYESLLQEQGLYTSATPQIAHR